MIFGYVRRPSLTTVHWEASSDQVQIIRLWNFMTFDTAQYGWLKGTTVCTECPFWWNYKHTRDNDTGLNPVLPHKTPMSKHKLRLFASFVSLLWLSTQIPIETVSNFPAIMSLSFCRFSLNTTTFSGLNNDICLWNIAAHNARLVVGIDTPN